MEPLRLRLPTALAAELPSLLMPEGFEIESANAGREWRLRCGRAEFQVTSTVSSDETTLDTTGIGDTRIRRHVELALRASGARFTIDELNDFSTDGLYRGEPAALFSALEELRRRGTPSSVAHRSPLCPSRDGTSSGPYWTGTVGTPAQRIRLETGPSYAAPSMPGTIFVAACPEYWIWASRRVRALMTALDGSLQAHGATCVVRSVLLDRPAT
jgi:hypothetical protein